MVLNNWNDRAAGDEVRSQDVARPWYQFGLRLLAAHVPTGDQQPALDVGCGVGEVLEMLQRRQFAVTGVDGNAEQIAVVRQNGFQAEIADLEKGLPFPDGCFQIVVCMEVIEHIARAENLLQESNRVLKPGGLLLLTTPNFAYVGWRLRYLFGSGPLREGIHIRHFTRARLTSCLQRAGFTILDRASYGPVPFANTLVSRMLKRPLLLWRITPRLESLMAFDFVYLAKKTG